MNPADVQSWIKDAEKAFSQATDLDSLKTARLAHLGDKAPISLASRSLGSLAPDEKASSGKVIGEGKAAITAALQKATDKLEAERDAKVLLEEIVDITLPVKRSHRGGLHPITIIKNEISDFFIEQGYAVEEGPELESGWLNFDALNIPPDHPARTMQDTFYIEPVESGMVLRTQTSPVQIRSMLENEPPIYMICPGRTFRADELDATHSPVFHQVEGLVVDITNYVMLELGQPLHAFDKSKISGGLTIKRAGKAQKFITLDGQERNLDPDDLMVCDDKQPLALAGTMGGLSSEITDTTPEIALEAVRFDPDCVAKNSRRHKLSSEASRRLERSVDPSLAEFASARFVQLLTAHSSAKYVATSVDGEPRYSPVITLDPAYIPRLLGFDIAWPEIARNLRIIGCDVDEKSFQVDPPSWRSDLLTPSDLAEEVARMIGYEKIPSILPPRPKHASLTPTQKRHRAIANMLASRGLAEVQTFPFTNQETIDQMGFVGERAATYRIANPMSEENPLMRVHLVPGLIEVAARNTSRGAKDFAIFEMGSIFRSAQKLIPAISPGLLNRPDAKIISEIYKSVPPQAFHVAGLLVGKAENENWQGKARAYTWQDAIALAQEILDLCNLKYSVKRSDFAPWHPGRCAELIVDGKAVAHAGEVHPRILAKYGLPERSAAFAVGLSALPDSDLVKPTRVGTMPAAVQDVALIIDSSVSAQDVEAALRAGAGELLESISLFDRYDKLGDGQISLAFTLTFRAEDRTLTGAEVSEMRNAAVDAAQKATGATIRTA